MAEDYSFDVDSFSKPPFEWGGYLEFKQEHQSLDANALLTPYSQPSEERSTLNLELEAEYNWNRTRVSGVFRAQRLHDDFIDDNETSVHQAYIAHQYNDRLNQELGKRSLRWGKGYAWNPVAFVERSKDPLDPDLSREGYLMATADYIQSSGGPLKTWAFTPVLLPVSDDMNVDFGPQDENVAAKLYLLYRDIDIDLLYRNQGSRPERVGIDFAANLASNFEIHGEWAHGRYHKPVLIGNSLIPRQETVNNILLGLRYLSERDATYILEYYHNEEGYTEEEMQTFYDFIQAPATTASQARLALARGYNKPQHMRNYLYLRITQKEPFDILYFTPGITLIHNLDDQSYTVSPEFSYTRITNLELRLRANLFAGDDETEFGSKAVDNKVEFRLRYFF